jgi:hypothetical protein
MVVGANLENAPDLKTRHIHCIHGASSLMNNVVPNAVLHTFFGMAQACGLTHLIFVQAEPLVDANLSATLIVHTAFILVPRSDLAVSQLSHEQKPSSGSYGATSSRAQCAKSRRSRSLHQQHQKRFIRLESAYMCYGDAIDLLVPLFPLYPLLYSGKVQIQFKQYYSSSSPKIPGQYLLA